MIPRFLYYVSVTRRDQWLNPRDLKELRDRKFRSIILHAYRNVPFYRKSWKDADVDLDSVRSVDDIEKIPVLTKDDLRNNIADMLATGYDADRCVKRHTSGSSGPPLSVMFDHGSYDFLSAVGSRSFSSEGKRPLGRFVEISEEDPFRKKGLLESYNKKHIPSTLTEDEKISMIVKFSPEAIVGFPSTLAMMAKLIHARTDLAKIRPRLIVSHGEILTKETRELIESAFRCEVFDQYGCEEVGIIGWECQERSGLHISEDSVYMEVDHREGGGKEEGGRILLTGLVNRAMPLIRYDIGDVGSMGRERCPCGRGFGLMDMVGGRMDDFIVLSSGRLLGPRNICGGIDVGFLYNFKISGFRVVQEKKGSVTVMITKGSSYSEDVDRDIADFMAQQAKEPIGVEVKMLDELPKDKSGKRRYVVSKVKQ